MMQYNLVHELKFRRNLLLPYPEQKSEMMTPIYQSKWGRIPEDRNHDTNHRENVRFQNTIYLTDLSSVYMGIVLKFLLCVKLVQIKSVRWAASGYDRSNGFYLNNPQK
jgi:hypothetical protein